MPKPTHLIVKSNDLIEADYSFDIWELRVFTYMVSLIKKDDADFKTYAIPISDLMITFGLKNKNIYQIIRGIPDKLLSKIISIPYTDKQGRSRLVKTPLVSSVDIPLERQREGVIYLRFDPVLKPFLLQLSERFTSYDLKNVMQFSSPYPFRMYELLKSHAWKSNKSLTVTVDELRKFLQVGGKYAQYKHLKGRVLAYTQKELAKHTDISFTFKEKKQGRRVVKITFLIKSKTNIVIEENSDSLDLLTSIGVTKKVAIDLTGKHSKKLIARTVAEAKAKNGLKSRAAYTVKALDEGYYKEEEKIYKPVATRRVKRQEQNLALLEKQFKAELKKLTNQLLEQHLTDALIEKVIDENKTVAFVRKYKGNIEGAKSSSIVMSFVSDCLQKTYLQEHQYNFESWIKNKQ